MDASLFDKNRGQHDLSEAIIFIERGGINIIPVRRKFGTWTQDDHENNEKELKRLRKFQASNLLDSCAKNSCMVPARLRMTRSSWWCIVSLDTQFVNPATLQQHIFQIFIYFFTLRIDLDYWIVFNQKIGGKLINNLLRNCGNHTGGARGVIGQRSSSRGKEFEKEEQSFGKEQDYQQGDS